MSKSLRTLRHFWFLFVYLAVTVYMLIFPATASWYIFYVFTLWLLLSFFSTRQSYHLTHMDRFRTEDNQHTFSFIIANKSRTPYFVSTVEITMLMPHVQKTDHVSVLFNRQIASRFHSVPLPRGHHDKLTLDITSTGLFGVWKRHTRLIVPVAIDIFPHLLTKSEREKLMYTIDPRFTRPSRSFEHDYYMNELRAFQNRDTLSGIDWKASLKRGEWMVKEYETEEESPIALYFLGLETHSFEALLSLAYSLLQDLKKTQKVDVYLMGRFGEEVKMEKTEDSFLTIEPAGDQNELAQLFHQLADKKTRKIIIRSRTFTAPLPPFSDFDHHYIDEELLDQVKGGESDNEYH